MTSQASTRKYYKNIRKRLLKIIDEGCPVEIEDQDNPITLFETNLEKAVDNLDDFLADIERYVPKRTGIVDID